MLKSLADPDPNLFRSCSDPDPNKNENQDPDPNIFVSDPQHFRNVLWLGMFCALDFCDGTFCGGTFCGWDNLWVGNFVGTFLVGRFVWIPFWHHQEWRMRIHKQ